MCGAPAIEAATVRRDQLVVLELALLTETASTSGEKIRALFRIGVEDEGLEVFAVFLFPSAFYSPRCALL